MTTVGELASIVRSKNAGPFELTFDLFFEDAEDFRRVADSGAISEARVADHFDVPEEDVVGVYEVPQVNAIKISITRSVPAGSARDTDVYGAQQHMPLFDIEL